jgi:hypothetical protein
MNLADPARSVAQVHEYERLVLPERRRAPRGDEPSRIFADQILVVPKLSRLELDRRAQGLADPALRQWYEQQGIDSERIFNSHRRQAEALREIRAVLPESLVIEREQLTYEHITRAKLVLSLGGDNHFCYLASLVTDTMLIGINSDPAGSEGAMMRAALRGVREMRRALEGGDFLVEDWTRLDVRREDISLGRVLNDVFLGEAERHCMSRHRLELWKHERGEPPRLVQAEEQKGSGLLVATGSDSYGWYQSASRFLHPEGAPFPRTAQEGRFLLTEPYCGTLSCSRFIEGRLDNEHRLRVVSYNDGRGVAVLDSGVTHPFGRGDRIEVAISDAPLKVPVW